MRVSCGSLQDNARVVEVEYHKGCDGGAKNVCAVCKLVRQRKGWSKLNIMSILKFLGSLQLVQTTPISSET